MNTKADEGFDRTPQGQAMAQLLRRHAPPDSDAHAGAKAVMERVAGRGRRINLMRWLVPAATAAAAALIVLVIALPDNTRAPAPPTETPRAAPAAAVSRGVPATALVTRLRGPLAGGWRLDAGLQDGLRVGDRLQGAEGAVAIVTAAGIFDSRVRVEGAASRGSAFMAIGDSAAMRRAARLGHLGGDPGAFLHLGAVFDYAPYAEARMMGLADGRALRAAEVIPAILRDFAGEPEISLAARMGLQRGDVIEAANGLPVRDLGELAAALDAGLGGRMSVTVMRIGQRLELVAR